MILRKNISAVAFQLLLVVIATFRVHIDVFEKQSVSLYRPSVVDGVLINYPKIKKRFQYVNVNNYKIVTSRFPLYKLGDYIVVKTRPDNGHGSVYGRDNYKESVLMWPVIKVDKNKRDDLLKFISLLHEKVVNRANKLLPMPYSSLFLGMVFGIDQELPDPLYQKFYNGGVLHVIVASGYNVSIILSILFFFLRYTNRYLHLSISIGVLLVYLFLSGVSAPLVRASIMGVVFLLSRLSGIYISPLLILVFTFNVMLVIKPDYVQNVGFWMSVVAMVSLILSSTLTNESPDISSGHFYNGLKETIFVNLFLFPITAFFFNTISLGGLIANPLSLWLLPFVIVFGLVYFITGFGLFGTLTIGFLDLFIKIVTIVGLYIKNTTIVGFSLSVVMVSYSFLFSIFFIFRYLIKRNHA